MQLPASQIQDAQTEERSGTDTHSELGKPVSNNSRVRCDGSKPCFVPAP